MLLSLSGDVESRCRALSFTVVPCEFTFPCFVGGVDEMTVKRGS